MDDPIERFRSRREARAAQVRQRRAGVLVALLAAVVAAVAVVLAAGGGGGHTASPNGSASGSAAAAAGGPRGHRGSQIAAVERLAAYGLPLYCAGGSKPLVALTFDDGPGVYTRLALRKLRAHHARATFFLVGKQIRAYPGLARLERPLAAVGDHTMTHPFLPALSHAQMAQELSAAKTLIAAAAGQPVVLFRPPYEGHNPQIDHEARTLGMLQVLWNVDSADSLGANYAGIEQNVIAGLHAGSIILMHENRGQTIRALPAIFAALAHKHLRAVTVPELIAADPPSLAQLRAGGHGCGVSARRGSGG